MGLAPALISAGTTLLSGLLGGKQKKGIDLAALRRDAIANGFNPLTVLSATGGGGYERSSGPSLSSGAFLAEAIQRGVDTYFNTPPKEDVGAKSIRLANDYIAAKKAARERQPFGAGLTEPVPFGTIGAGYSPRLGALNAGSSNVGAPSPAVAGGAGLGPSDDPRVQFPMGLSNGPITLSPLPGVSDSEAWETRYGDLLQSVVGVGNLGADAGFTFRKWVDRKYWEYETARRQAALSPSRIPKEPRKANYRTVRYAGPLASFR